jgi:hypothetical protein
MRVVVTGSRYWLDEKTMRAVLDDLLDKDYTVLIHGGAQGADTMAGRIAREMGHHVEVVRAEWSRFGSAAGPLRNRVMLDRGADLVIAFPRRSSVGTWDCVREAERRGIKVHVVRTYL